MNELSALVSRESESAAPLSTLSSEYYGGPLVRSLWMGRVWPPRRVEPSRAESSRTTSVEEPDLLLLTLTRLLVGWRRRASASELKPKASPCTVLQVLNQSQGQSSTSTAPIPLSTVQCSALFERGITHVRTYVRTQISNREIACSCSYSF